ncbi:alginate export family protein [Zhongshania aquimaris]|uniref:Alginate export family protein n=1 Tax=Zhongshania aquimaris TaxID=2857107 RepID=A0ABS6VVE4_9GAMM|nr:alginate export family protein [Zhongshania aquimaris]MBW2942309.1 alginate export family protein [Zhongshania aquimaris]
MKINSLPTVVLASCVACAAQTSFTAESISEAFTKGEAHLNLRMRYESVTEDTSAGDNTGSAVTLRSRLNFKTDGYQGFYGFVEMDDVSNFTGSANDSVNGKTAEPLIADPVGTEVNQVFLGYKNWDTEFKYGRQRLTLDNHRFVGHVAWRQNEQTYDGFTIANSSVDKLKLNYAHISNVNRIFGESSPVGDTKMDTHLFNANYTFAAGSLTGYAYLLESDDNFAGFKRMDTDTYGVRWQGKTGIVAYNLEYASQDSAGDNPADYSADYMLAEANISVAPLVIGVGYETLSADDEGFFITPLATLFKFQGWTDNFLNKGLGNISEGINDAYLTVSGVAYGMSWQIAYHDFSSDQDNASGDSDLGSEFGGFIAKSWGAYSAELRYANYSAGDSTPFNGGGLTLVDTQKLWLTFNLNF